MQGLSWPQTGTRRYRSSRQTSPSPIGSRCWALQACWSCFMAGCSAEPKPHDQDPMNRTLFGHPIGLTTLFGTEMWERFSYYGMRALLILYLTKYVLLSPHVEHVLFYPQVKAFFEMLSGHALSTQPLSSLIYGTYTGLIYATPWLGGWVADAWLGQRKTALIGILTMAFGHFMMASEALLFPAL